MLNKNQHIVFYIYWCVEKNHWNLIVWSDDLQLGSNVKWKAISILPNDPMTREMILCVRMPPATYIPLLFLFHPFTLPSSWWQNRHVPPISVHRHPHMSCATAPPPPSCVSHVTITQSINTLYWVPRLRTPTPATQYNIRLFAGSTFTN